MEKDLRLEMDLDNFVKDQGAIQFRRAMDQAHQDFEKNRNYQIIFRAAAVFLFLMTVGTISWMIWPSKSNMDSIASRYFRSYQSLASVRSGNVIADQAIEKAFSFYNQRDFSKAEQEFRSVLAANPDQSMARLYLGLSLMENNKIKEAIPVFKIIVEKNDVLYRAQSEWYLSLCLLKAEQKDEAVVHLKNLASRNGHYKEMAGKLLNELK